MRHVILYALTAHFTALLEIFAKSIEIFGTPIFVILAAYIPVSVKHATSK